MNIPEFIPGRLKDARLLLGFSQSDLAKQVQMQQKDISLHENRTTKALIPIRYLLFLYAHGIDLNSLFDESIAVRLRGGVPLDADEGPPEWLKPFQELQGRIAKLEAKQRKGKVLDDEVSALLQEALVEAFAPREQKRATTHKRKNAG